MNSHNDDSEDVTLAAGSDVVAQIRAQAARLRSGEASADDNELAVWTPDTGKLLPHDETVALDDATRAELAKAVRDAHAATTDGAGDALASDAVASDALASGASIEGAGGDALASGASVEGAGGDALASGAVAGDALASGATVESAAVEALAADSAVDGIGGETVGFDATIGAEPSIPVPAAVPSAGPNAGDVAAAQAAAFDATQPSVDMPLPEPVIDLTAAPSLIAGQSPPEAATSFWTNEQPFRASGIDGPARMNGRRGIPLGAWIAAVIVLIVVASVGIAVAVAATGPLA